MWGSGEMATVDRVKISDGNKLVEMARGTAGKETEVNRTLNWM